MLQTKGNCKRKVIQSMYGKKCLININEEKNILEGDWIFYVVQTKKIFSIIWWSKSFFLLQRGTISNINILNCSHTSICFPSIPTNSIKANVFSFYFVFQWVNTTNSLHRLVKQQRRVKDNEKPVHRWVLLLLHHTTDWSWWSMLCLYPSPPVPSINLIEHATKW